MVPAAQSITNPVPGVNSSQLHSWVGVNCVVYDESDEDGEFGGADEETAMVACPYCRRSIPEDTPRCPYCENYISAEDTPPSRKPWWIVLGALAVAFVVYLWVTRR
jgi:hypothetical protein